MTTYLVVVETVVREVFAVSGAESEDHAKRMVTDDGFREGQAMEVVHSDPITHPLVRHIVVDRDDVNAEDLMREQHERDGLKWAHETEVVRYTGGNDG